MALTKVGKEGITGISNSSNANAITIDSSERVGIGTSVPTELLHLNANNPEFAMQAASDGGECAIYFKDDDGNKDGRITYRTDYAGQTDNYMQFFTNGSERLRVLGGGGITFNGDTAAANALDDYEEGTFTPSFTGGITGSSYEDQNGTYVKIGQLVFFALELDVTNGAASTNGNQIKIDNIPFVSAAASPMVYGQGGAWVTFNNNFYNVDTGIYLEIPTNSNQIRLYRGSGNSLVGTDSGVNAQNNLHIAGCYRTA